MSFAFLVLGVVIGGAIAWYLLQQRLVDLDRQHKQQLDRQRQTLEQDFEMQKQTARKTYDRELQALKAELNQLKARSAAPSPAPRVAAPTPTPVPAPAASAATPAAKLPDPWRSAAVVPSPVPAPLPEPEPTPEPEPIATPEPEVIAASEPEPIAAPEPEPVAAASEPTVATSAAPSPLDQVASLAARVRSLGQRAEARSPIADLVTLASHTDPQVRAAAISALAPVGSPEVVALLQKSLRDASLIVVRAAAKALDRYKTCPPIDANAPEPTLPPNGSPQKS